MKVAITLAPAAFSPGVSCAVPDPIFLPISPTLGSVATLCILPDSFLPLPSSSFLLPIEPLPPPAFQEYAQLVRLLGNGRAECYCFDGTTRLGHVRGKMRKKVRHSVAGQPQTLWDVEPSVSSLKGR